MEIKIFHSTFSGYECYNGPVEVLRQLTENEADTEVGPMFECKAKDGTLFHAYGDELT